MFEWGTLISAKTDTGSWKKAIYICENDAFRDPDVDGKYFVIFEGDEELSETNGIKASKATKKNTDDTLTWGDYVKVWDDEYNKKRPYRGIYLATYSYSDDETYYVVIPKNHTSVPEEGFLHCEKIKDA